MLATSSFSLAHAYSRHVGSQQSVNFPDEQGAAGKQNAGVQHAAPRPPFWHNSAPYLCYCSTTTCCIFHMDTGIFMFDKRFARASIPCKQ